MKYLKLLGFLVALLPLTSCEKEDNTNGDTNEVIIVDPYKKVSVNGEARVVYVHSTSEHSVKINATSGQRNNIIVRNNGETLEIVCNGIKINDGVVITITGGYVSEIKLEANQTAIFDGVFNPTNLEVKTEGGSELTLLNTATRNIISKQEGESVLNLSSLATPIPGPALYPENDVVVLDNKTIVVNNEFVVVGDSVVLNTSTPAEYRVHGNDLHEYYLIDNVDFKTEGNSTINAREAAIWDVQIKLEGSSQAYVWALNSINGKGEGSSVLTYRGNPIISGFIIEGGAQIIQGN